MQLSDLPARFNIPFANNAGSGFIRQVPQAHQNATLTDAPASLFDGFPPETFTPLDTGGIPPNGADMNGILNQISATCRWLQAGGPAIFNSAFSTAIGGYPRGTVLTSTANPLVKWVSSVDNNTTDPDGGAPANWSRLSSSTIERDGSNNWKRIGPDGFIEMGGIFPGPLANNEYSFSFTFPFGGFPSEFLGMSTMTRNTTSGRDGVTTFQEVSANRLNVTLFVQSSEDGSKDRAGGFRWRAWGI